MLHHRAASSTVPGSASSGGSASTSAATCVSAPPVSAPALRALGSGCRVQGQGAGCRVQGAWCMVQGARCRVQGTCLLQLGRETGQRCPGHAVWGERVHGGEERVEGLGRRDRGRAALVERVRQ